MDIRYTSLAVDASQTVQQQPDTLPEPLQPALPREPEPSIDAISPPAPAELESTQPPSEPVPAQADESLDDDAHVVMEPVSEEGAQTVPFTGDREQGPLRVVERYIAAWNCKAFGAEYECFSPSLIGSTSKEDYMNRRMATYLTYKRKGDFDQAMGTVLKSSMEGDHATVLCIRRVREFHQMNRYHDLYELCLEGEKWRIVVVSTEIARDVDGKGQPNEQEQQEEEAAD